MDFSAALVVLIDARGNRANLGYDVTLLGHTTRAEPLASAPKARRDGKKHAPYEPNRQGEQQRDRDGEAERHERHLWRRVARRPEGAGRRAEGTRYATLTAGGVCRTNYSDTA